MTDAEMMIAVLTIAVIAAAIFAVVAQASIVRHERHERILSPFEKIRSNLLGVILAPHDEYSPREDAAARFLITTINGVIRHYHPHKTTIFNLRDVRRTIEKDLRRYRKTQEMVRSQMADLPEDSKVREAFADFAVATIDAFIANTPFIRSEIILRWLWRDLAEQMKNARRDSEKVLHEMRMA